MDFDICRLPITAYATPLMAPFIRMQMPASTQIAVSKHLPTAPRDRIFCRISYSSQPQVVYLPMSANLHTKRVIFPLVSYGFLLINVLRRNFLQLLQDIAKTGIKFTIQLLVHLWWGKLPTWKTDFLKKWTS